MSNLAIPRRAIITEQTVMLMSTPLETDAHKHSVRADISIDYIDPEDPARVIQHYGSQPVELKIELPGSYRNFFAECLFKTKVEFGLLRHRAVSVQHVLEVQGKAEGSKTIPSQTLNITKANWAEIQRYLFGGHSCRLKLTARTSREPWSIDYDPDTKLPYIPGEFPARPRASLRPSHYCQNSASSKRRHAPNARKNQKFGPRFTKTELLPNQPGRLSRFNSSKTIDLDVPVDNPVAKKDKDKEVSWFHRLFELCVGRKARGRV